VRFVANEERVYRYAIDQYNGVATTGVSRDDLLRGGAELRRFFNNDADTLEISVTRNGQPVSLFNARETTHLLDVKERFRVMNIAQELSVLYIVVYVAAVVLWAREVSVRRLAVQTALGCALLLAAVGAVGAIGLAGFDTAWEDFHKVLFDNDFWRLNPASDRLIQMFPPAFWESIVFFIGLLVLAEAALLLIFSLLYIGITGHDARARRFEPEYA
jgi:integral membrane protein (TIGR01906 family)